MKKLMALLVLLGALIAGAPFVSGMLVEKRYQALLAESAFDRSVDLHGERYQRGWFSSTIVTQVEITEPQIAIPYTHYRTKANEAAGIENGETRPLFRVESVVHHGPAWLTDGFGIGLARVDSRLLLSDEERAQIGAVFEGEALSMQTTVHFGRSAEVALNSSKAVYTKPGTSDQTALFHPVTSKWLIADKGNRIEGEMAWPGMDVSGVSASGGKFEMHFSEAVLKTSMQKRAGLWMGNLTMDQEEWLFDNGQGQRAVFQGLHLDSKSGSNTNEALVDADVTMKLGSADVAGEAYGPGSCRIAMSNLPIDTLVKIQEIQDQIVRASMEAPAGSDVSAASMQMLILLPELFSRGVVIEMSELKMHTPHGDVDGNLKVALPETAPERLMNPQYLKQLVRADAELTVPAIYFNKPQTAQATYNLAKGGLIEQQNGMLHSTLHMADGQLAINGKPFPLPF